MTNIAEKKGKKNMQMHIDAAYLFLNEYLPPNYSPQVKAKLKLKGIEVTTSTVNNVRNKVHLKIDVLNALVEVAKNNQAQLEELIENVKQIK